MRTVPRSGEAVIARRKRLAIVMGGHWLAQMGGAQFQAKCLLEALAAHQEFDVFYLANRVPRNYTPEGYRLLAVGTTCFAWARLLPHLPSLYRSLAAVRPDVIYQRSLTPYTAVCALYARRHRIRFVFHIASDVDARRVKFKGWKPDALVLRLSRWLADYGLRHASDVVAQTKDQAASVAASYGVKVVAVVPNFHPAPSNEPHERSSGRLRVIWVANFKTVKRPELFIDLAERFRDRVDVEFVMIGRPGGAEHAPLQQRIAALKNLSYLGEQPLEVAEREIGASDLLVNTSAYEGFPNTFIQAWLRGVPVLSADVDPDQCLSRGGAGVYSGGAEHLAGTLRALLDDPAALKRLGDSARSYAQHNHGFEQAERLIGIIRQGAEAGGAPAGKANILGVRE